MVELKLFLMPPLKQSGRLSHDSSLEDRFIILHQKLNSTKCR